MDQEIEKAFEEVGEVMMSLNSAIIALEKKVWSLEKAHDDFGKDLESLD